MTLKCEYPEGRCPRCEEHTTASQCDDPNCSNYSYHYCKRAEYLDKCMNVLGRVAIFGGAVLMGNFFLINSPLIALIFYITGILLAMG